VAEHVLGWMLGSFQQHICLCLGEHWESWGMLWAVLWISSTHHESRKMIVSSYSAKPWLDFWLPLRPCHLPCKQIWYLERSKATPYQHMPATSHTTNIGEVKTDGNVKLWSFLRITVCNNYFHSGKVILSKRGWHHSLKQPTEGPCTLIWKIGTDDGEYIAVGVTTHDGKKWSVFLVCASCCAIKNENVN
jgi:hypothetical protein